MNKKSFLIFQSIRWGGATWFVLFFSSFAHAQNIDLSKSSENIGLTSQLKNFIQTPPVIADEPRIQNGSEKISSGSNASQKSRFVKKPAGTEKLPEAGDTLVKILNEKPVIQNNKKPLAQGTGLEKFYRDFDLAVLEKNKDSMRHALDQLKDEDMRFHLGVMRRKGWYLFVEKKYQEALDVYLQIIQRLPSDRNAIINASLLEISLGEEQQGLSRLKYYQMLNPNDGDANRLINRFDNHLN